MSTVVFFFCFIFPFPSPSPLFLSPVRAGDKAVGPPTATSWPYGRSLMAQTGWERCACFVCVSVRRLDSGELHEQGRANTPIHTLRRRLKTIWRVLGITHWTTDARHSSANRQLILRGRQGKGSQGRQGGCQRRSRWIVTGAPLIQAPRPCLYYTRIWEELEPVYAYTSIHIYIVVPVSLLG